MILGMEPKNQVTWVTCCKVMAKYVSIYFDMHYENVVHSALPTARYFFFFNDMHWELRYAWPLDEIGCTAGTSSKNCFF